MLEFFDKKVTTPHILAEVSNLLGPSRENQAGHLFKTLSGLIMRLDEHHIAGRQIASHGHLATFGLTDLGILEISVQHGCLVGTGDSALASYLRRNGVEAIDIETLRSLDSG